MPGIHVCSSRVGFIALLLTCLLFLAPAAAEPTDTGEVVRVAVYTGGGTGKSKVNLLMALRSFPRLEVTEVTAEEIQSGKLKQFDVVCHPGGSGSAQAKALGDEGRNAIRDFVGQGGGFVGFCAGAYLATNDYSWSLGILDAKVIDKKHWARGMGSVTLTMTPRGKVVLDVRQATLDIFYGQGPLLQPNEDPDTPDYVPLATYKTEIARNGAPEGVMPGTTAIAAGIFGEGRVFCFSPHPEKTGGLDRWVRQAVLYSAGQLDKRTRIKE
jgi:hypothetical protein